METIIKSEIPNSKNFSIILSEIKQINVSEKDKAINFLLVSGHVIGWSYDSKEDWATDYNYLLRNNPSFF